MISAVLIALSAAAAQPAAPIAPATLAYGPDTLAHLKGHHVAPASEKSGKVRVSATGCHPDPHKGRSCRLHAAKLEQLEREALARSGHEESTDREVAP
ncbi:hypothetical protein B2G71_06040 [Novosphingobium sp. PC22D]|uniref:hypothetical protein n=1 Tax=Novosphingobium sp. PC22D TaxID=1962403 RepID=UPI000BF03EEE|nr:hypothetical protein [Novosphingobium sp. PC22D]PEQ13862.1 hypothetical protein B2G71_06040 [Novosphingobium sp. PC22D]